MNNDAKLKKGFRGSLENRVVKVSILDKSRQFPKCPGEITIFLSSPKYTTKEYGGVYYQVMEFDDTQVSEDETSYSCIKIHTEAVYMPNLERHLVFGKVSIEGSKLEEIQPDDDIPEVWKRERYSSKHTCGPYEMPYECQRWQP